MIHDLSLHHGLVGGLFLKPSSSEEWSKYRLSAEQVEFYCEHGYLAGVRMLSDDQVEALRDELQQLLDPEHTGPSAIL